jgi:hypothetical protein
MNYSGDIIKCRVPSRHGVLSFGTTRTGSGKS